MLFVDDVFRAQILVPELGSILSAQSDISESPSVSARFLPIVLVGKLSRWPLMNRLRVVSMHHAYLFESRTPSSINEMGILHLFP